ncbi:alpha/beta hydrolase [Crossiella sp. SN42]|uniref:alpha/beta hydrolase n=1 Tax=Crossiella sp. SN42 TaxID=2944808 RepID=UPI00207D5098|nr:alpha/beta hydrolase [Crossiella sp. SN42]MCO1575703.1 alpha/beta hydrolase [Crossiella sp. SN42]
MAKQDLILIHGTWGNGENWGEFGTELQARGFRVHRPTARHHGNPRQVDVWANAQRMTKLGLLDFVADYAELVGRMATPPIIVGHSLGALLAQLLAARVPHRGQILLGTAPAWGMHTFDLAPMALWGRYLPRWLAGQPMYPVSKKVWDSHICNATPREISDPFYDSLCAESGTVYRQMVLWFLDHKRRAKVDYRASDAPVLVIAGELDKCTVPRIGRVTARKYGARGSFVQIPGADHMMNAGTHLPGTLKAIDDWLDRHQLRP